VLLGLSAWGWIALFRNAPRGRSAALLVVAAICARLWAVTLAPAWSEDVFRFVYEGRVALLRGPMFPFVHAPAEAPFLDLPPELLDAAWLRINHAAIPTLYPPLTQAVLVLGVLLGGLIPLKLALVLAELAACAVVAKISRPAALAMLACPLAISEIAREGHAESLVMLGIAIGAAYWGRPRLSALGFAIAALAKLVGAIPLVLVARAAPRRAWPALILAAAAFAPYALGSSAGLELYAESWRSGDGAFALISAATEAVMGGTWARVGEDTITRDAVARAVVAVVFAALFALRLRKRPGIEDAALVLLLLLLLSPTLHPWYALWLLPFAVLVPRWAPPMLWLIAAAPLLHHPGWLALEDGVWRELPGLLALVHLPAWALLLAIVVRAPRSSRPRRPKIVVRARRSSRPRRPKDGMVAQCLSRPPPSSPSTRDASS